MSESERPPLSVVIPAREGLSEVAAALGILLPQAAASAAEVIVVGGPPGPAPPGVRHLPSADQNMLSLRMIGVREACGDVIAIGEDHAIPEPGWCAAIIRAHAENADADAVVGCLVNASGDTISGRANFLAFASPWAPPMPAVPDRPPPSSTISLKRAVVAALERVGELEGSLIPELWGRRRIAADERVRVLHLQDHGARWSIRNGFWSARASHGYAREHLSPGERRARARTVLTFTPRKLWREARAGRAVMPGPRRDMVLVAAIAAAAGVGAAVGMLAGPGRSPQLVA